MNNRNPHTPEEEIYSLYGRNPPVQCLGRLQTERNVVSGDFYDDVYLAAKLRYEADKAGTDLDVACGVGSSILFWLEEASNVNPLPSHYRCSVCKRVVFIADGDGWDLPELECCGKPMIRDGHRIPVESMMHTIKIGNRERIFRVAKSFSQRAVDIIRDHYKRQFVVVTFQDSSDCVNERGLALIPVGEPLPMQNGESVWHTDLESVYQSGYRIIRLVFDENKEQLRQLREKTGMVPDLDELLTPSVMSLTEAKLKEEICEEGGIVLKSDPLSFSSLLKVYGYLHGCHTEENPAFHEEGSRFSDVFTCREDVWDLVAGKLNPEFQLSSEFAWTVTRRTGTGQYTRNRMTSETEQVLRGLEISQYWIDQMKHTMFLRSKADLISRLLDEMGLAWYELQEIAN